MEGTRPFHRATAFAFNRSQQAHDAAISKVSWAHPEFGTVLASSSFDRTVKVWEQIPVTESDAPQVNGSGGAAGSSKWVERAMLVDAKGTVRAIEFAPQHFGLKLVSVCSVRFLIQNAAVIFAPD